jgi:hypothetical protein
MTNPTNPIPPASAVPAPHWSFGSDQPGKSDPAPSAVPAPVPTEAAMQAVRSLFPEIAKHADEVLDLESRGHPQPLATSRQTLLQRALVVDEAFAAHVAAASRAAVEGCQKAGFILTEQLAECHTARCQLQADRDKHRAAHDKAAGDAKRCEAMLEKEQTAHLVTRIELDKLNKLPIIWELRKIEDKLTAERADHDSTKAELAECYSKRAELEEGVEIYSEKLVTEQQAHATTRRELEELAGWKQSALSVLNKIDLQKIGDALDVPLGADVSDKILPGIKSLQAQLDQARAEVESIQLSVRKTCPFLVGESCADALARNIKEMRAEKEDFLCRLSMDGLSIAKLEATATRHADLAKELQKDKARMDWIESQCGLILERCTLVKTGAAIHHVYDPREEGIDDACGEELGEGQSFREAIDAALARYNEAMKEGKTS